MLLHRKTLSIAGANDAFNRKKKQDFEGENQFFFPNHLPLVACMPIDFFQTGCFTMPFLRRFLVKKTYVTYHLRRGVSARPPSSLSLVQRTEQLVADAKEPNGH